MRKLPLLIAAIVALAVSVPVALASSVHLKGGSNAKPTFNDQGLKLNATGALTGLGNQNILITLMARGNPKAVCINPSGKNQPPGQNPAPVTLSGTQSIPASAIKNGNVAFNVTTGAPASPIPGAPDCPNTQWSEVITDVAFTSATIVVEQPRGTVVLTVRCSFSSPTKDGAVPTGSVRCTSS